MYLSQVSMPLFHNPFYILDNRAVYDMSRDSPVEDSVSFDNFSTYNATEQFYALVITCQTPFFLDNDSKYW